MTIEDEEYAPRPDASQRAAARARRTLGAAPDAPPVVRQYPLVAIGAVAAVVLMLIAATWQLSQAPAKPLQLPTAPAHVFSRPQEGPREPRTAPTIAPAQIFPSPVPAVPVEPAPVVAPQTGRGMPAEVAPAVMIEPAPEVSQYILNVGAQAPHVPRGGHCGPTGGDCALGVPPGLDVSQYIANVGKQAPHKIR